MIRLCPVLMRRWVRMVTNKSRQSRPSIEKLAVQPVAVADMLFGAPVDAGFRLRSFR